MCRCILMAPLSATPTRSRSCRWPVRRAHRCPDHEPAEACFLCHRAADVACHALTQEQKHGGREDKRTNKSSFNPHEWQQILDSVTLAGMAVALTDFSHLGFFTFMKQMKVWSEEAMAAKDDPSANELTRAVSADFKNSVMMSEY